VVELVFTERRSDLSKERARNFDRLREQLELVSGEAVGVSHYEDVDAERLARASSVVLSGSTASWSDRDQAELDRLGEAVLASGRPVLGICAGMQLQVLFTGGEIGPGRAPEHGFLPVDVHDTSDLLRGLPAQAVVFHDHSFEVTALPEGFRVLASSPVCSVQAIAAPARRWWGTQFHPEEWSAEHPAGKQVLPNFFELAAG
jgi:GMP synthase-like glutamine amidotransferase